jgi:hypothetical protein
MATKESKQLIIIPDERIINKIYLIRGKKVMFDNDLAELYNVKTKVLNQAVKRNMKRFPDDFMFKLTKDEMEIWKSQIVISNEALRSQIVTSKKGGRRYRTYAFTEQGVSMLSVILNSDRAINVSIQIMRTFVKLREILLTHKELRDKIEAMERKYRKHDDNFKIVFKAIARLMKDDTVLKKRIGFKSG